MSIRELYQSMSRDLIKKIRSIFCAVRANDKETWHAIVDDMTDLERDLLIEACDAGIRERREARKA